MTEQDVAAFDALEDQTIEDALCAETDDVYWDIYDCVRSDAIDTLLREKIRTKG